MRIAFASVKKSVTLSLLTTYLENGKMLTLLTNIVKVYLHDDGTIHDAPESGALFGDIDSNVMFDSLDSFLATNTVTSIVSEDGYKFAVTDDGVSNDDISFDSLYSAIEALQS